MTYFCLIYFRIQGCSQHTIVDGLDAEDLIKNCSNGEIETVKEVAKIFGAEAVVNATPAMNCLTAAAKEGLHELVAYLINIGANVDKRDNKNWSVLKGCGVGVGVEFLWGWSRESESESELLRGWSRESESESEFLRGWSRSQSRSRNSKWSEFEMEIFLV